MRSCNSPDAEKLIGCALKKEKVQILKKLSDEVC